MSTTEHYTLIVSDVTVVMDAPKLEKVTGLEPYIIFQSGEAKAQTKASKNFEWRESFVLEKFQPSTTTLLEAEVYDKHTLFPDTNLGSGFTDLATLSPQSLDGKSQRVIIPLTNKKNVSVGSISFYLNAGGFRGRSYILPIAATQATAVAPAQATAGLVGITAVTGGSTTQGAKDAEAGTSEKKPALSSSSSSSSQEDLSTIETAGRRGGAATAAAGGGVVERKYYTSHEDRAREEALVEKLKEHQSFVQEYDTTVQHTGRERQVGTQVETLGKTERVLDVHERKDKTAADIVNPRLPAGTVEERFGGEGWVQGPPGPVVGVQSFEVTGEREVDKERVTALRKHRDIEKEFEVQIKLTGEHVQQPGRAEVVDRQRFMVGDSQAGGTRIGTQDPSDVDSGRTETSSEKHAACAPSSQRGGAYSS